MEMWDILDENGDQTGRAIARSTVLRKGEYHLVVHIWIIDPIGNVLIQKRPMMLAWMPGMWAATGGSAVQGEDSLMAAIRETHEELGLLIEPDRFRLYTRQKRENDFTDIWVVEGSQTEFKPIVPSQEVADAKWLSLEEVRLMIRDGDFIKYDYTDAFFESLKNLIKHDQ